MTSTGRTTTLREKIFETLKGMPETKLTARELAEKILEKYPDYEQEIKDNTICDTHDRVITFMGACISRSRDHYKNKHPEIKTIKKERSYRLYLYSEKQESEDEAKQYEQTDSIKTAASQPKKFPEEELYPIVTKYLHLAHKVFSTRIDETPNTGQKRGTNQWLFPDIVGAQDLTEKWTDEVKECVSSGHYKRIKLWSFEVKVKIDRPSLRECFFQTVANSSWANFAYLVATGLKNENDQSDIIGDLRMLCELYNVGYIDIDADEISESRIIIPAKEREINWAMADRLARVSEPFKKCLLNITKFHTPKFSMRGHESQLKESDWGIEISEED